MKIAIIPARGGSKRIKNKNITNFCGNPLIYYALDTARKTNLFDKIHVSTDSETIKTIVENLGFPIDFMRDPELADDHTGTLAVLQWVLEQYQQRNEHYKEVCLILPTAPLIEPQDIINAHRLFIAHKKNHSIMSVGTFSPPIDWAYRMQKNGILEPRYPGKFKTRSQDLEKTYYDSGTFIWFSAKRILENTLSGDQGFMAYVLDQHKAIDIDDEKELKFAEIIKLGLEKMKAQNE